MGCPQAHGAAAVAEVRVQAGGVALKPGRGPKRFRILGDKGGREKADLPLKIMHSSKKKDVMRALWRQQLRWG